MTRIDLGRKDVRLGKEPALGQLRSPMTLGQTVKLMCEPPWAKR